MDRIKLLEFLFEKSRFGEGLTKIEFFEKQKNLEFEEIIPIQIMKIRFYEKLGLYNEGIILANRLLQNRELSANPLFEIDIFIEMNKILFSMGKSEKIVKNLLMAEKKLLTIQSATELEILERMGDLVTLRMGCFWQEGELDNALFYAKFNLDIRVKLKKQLDIANAYNNIGVMYNAKGNLIEALSYLNQAFKLYSEINSTRGYSKTGNNIGAILIQLGRLNESLKYMEQSLEIDYSDGYMEGIRVASQNIGEVYWHKGEYEKALNHLFKALDLCSKSEDGFQFSEILVPIVAVLLEMNNLKLANYYLHQLELIKNQEENKIIQQRYFLTSAMVLRKSKSKGSLSNAEDLLKIIIEDDIRYHDITVMALLLISEILIDKFEKTNNLLIIEDIRKSIKLLVAITKDTKSYSLMVESLLMEAKLALLDIDFHFSQACLDKALKIANDFELNRIKTKVLNEYDVFLENYSFWDKISKKDQDNFKRKQLNMIKSQIRNFFSPKLEEFEKGEADTPLLLILMQIDGTIIVSQEFNEEWRINGMRFNIFQMNLYKYLRNYINNSVDFAQFEDNKIFLMKIGESIACYVYQGSSNSAIQKLSKFSEVLLENQPFLNKIKESIEVNHEIDLNRHKSFQNWIKNIFTTPIGVEII
ncbi:tetratricopeptide repeat protein [Promethearchaeum syntrophicum]|uniref:Tetratricopeptide repeat protein n=1 Tax=Promethearchaeum syntrophicum TaxID=2594042 RepID=A0A5B9DEU5_9ARCH|nr:tetratricopeptide repeat protein [Candidatus Prometheoarchaeum syntrophicum]QEE17644.1 Tetratricopeptide repeat protein [Candidatus Prometheoarchaeum syntrophicum]